MIAELVQHRDKVHALCEKHRVQRLEVFGSAAGDGFDPARSDIDLVVTFEPMPAEDVSDHYFELKEDLEDLFRRSVDLLTPASIRNRFLKMTIDATRQVLYAA